MRTLHPLFRFLPLLTATWLLAACDDRAVGQPAPPPPTVEVLTLETTPVANVVSLPGRVQAVRVAEIRARVTGIVQQRRYREGTDVKAGDELFLIDPREMRAALLAAQASLERARATAANAAQDLKRYQGLVAKQAISQQEFDAAQARLRTARADVAQAEAQVESARLNLEYTTVKTPIDGRAGRALVTEGALVSAQEATLLTTVEQSDPVQVIFGQSSSELLALRAKLAAGDLQLDQEQPVSVRLRLENGADYPHAGVLDFQAMSVDRATGTIEMRAEVPNPERLLLPGQFVTAYLEAGQRPRGLLVPQRAVIISERGPGVLLVSEDGLAERREIETGALIGSQWVVLSGLAPGDRVIVEGWQNLRPGTRVRSVPFGAAADEGNTDEPAP